MKKFQKMTTYRKIVFILFSALTVFCIWFIFSHSAKTAVESTIQSDSPVKILTDLINKIFKTSLTEKDTTGPVRTFAHIAEFAGLAFCFSVASEALTQRKKVDFATTIPFIVITATIDETIQIFFEGRAFQFSDILFDTLGGFSGVLFLGLLLKFIYKSNDGKRT